MLIVTIGGGKVDRRTLCALGDAPGRPMPGVICRVRSAQERQVTDGRHSRLEAMA